MIESSANVVTTTPGEEVRFENLPILNLSAVQSQQPDNRTFGLLPLSDHRRLSAVRLTLKCLWEAVAVAWTDPHLTSYHHSDEETLTHARFRALSTGTHKTQTQFIGLELSVVCWTMVWSALLIIQGHRIGCPIDCTCTG
jgi:hypothetical protein